MSARPFLKRQSKPLQVFRSIKQAVAMNPAPAGWNTIQHDKQLLAANSLKYPHRKK
jgi:hypothetical protein